MFKNPYQDVWIRGQAIESGRRDCAGRYEAIRKVLAGHPQPFRVLDFGAYLGYFSFRLAEEFDCEVLAVDTNRNLQLLAEKNHNPRVKVLTRRLDGAGIFALGRFDVTLALSVIHNCAVWRPVAEALLDSAPIVFVETITPAERTTAMNGAQAKPILEWLGRRTHAVLCRTPDLRRVDKRPMMLFAPTLRFEGKVSKGTGGARKHTELWRPHLLKLTGKTFADGTLNLRLDAELLMSASTAMTFPIQRGVFKLWPCTVNGYACYIAKPPLATWPPSVAEIMADVKLRDHLHLVDGDAVTLEVQP